MLLGKQAGEGADSLGEPIIQLVLDEGGPHPGFRAVGFLRNTPYIRLRHDAHCLFSHKAGSLQP